MTRVTIDLDVLRATMPKHPTWPTPGDTTDPKEADAVFTSLTEGWILGAQAEDKPLKGRLIDRIALAKMPTLCGHPDCGECWGRLSQWLEAALLAPESDNDRQHRATTPPGPETGTGRPIEWWAETMPPGRFTLRKPAWPPPTPDMHESMVSTTAGAGPCLRGCGEVYCPHPGGGEEYWITVDWVDMELAK